MQRPGVVPGVPVPRGWITGRDRHAYRACCRALFYAAADANPSTHRHTVRAPPRTSPTCVAAKRGSKSVNTPSREPTGEIHPPHSHARPSGRRRHPRSHPRCDRAVSRLLEPFTPCAASPSGRWWLLLNPRPGPDTWKRVSCHLADRPIVPPTWLQQLPDYQESLSTPFWNRQGNWPKREENLGWKGKVRSSVLRTTALAPLQEW
jgi:hypothetical protein